MEFNDRNIERLFTRRDFSPIATEIAAHEDLFERLGGADEDFRQAFKGSPFKDSPAIPCRMSYDFDEQPDEATLIEYLKTTGITNTAASDTEQYLQLPEVYKVVSWLAGQVHAEQIGRVLVARLIPGGTVKPHKDFGTYHDFYDRFHICVAGAGCYLRSDDDPKIAETVKMLPGEVYWFYNNADHDVTNDSATPRDHIVVDFKLKGEKNVFRRGGTVRELH